MDKQLEIVGVSNKQQDQITDKHSLILGINKHLRIRGDKHQVAIHGGNRIPGATTETNNKHPLLLNLRIRLQHSLAEMVISLVKQPILTASTMDQTIIKILSIT
jgi:hypothetical protein